ncbi:MAG: IS66 family transposase, partial [Herminiimonas sp.]|nr:IS66 family transposase [Herminiimonas sp.]
MQSNHQSDAKVVHPPVTLTAADMVRLLDVKDREIVHLRRQVAWFQRQIFGQKSERRVPEPDGVQGTLGELFEIVPDVPSPAKKSKIAAHEREHKNKNQIDSDDESALFFDDSKVPVEVIAVPNQDAAGLDPADYEVIGEKVSHRLAQRPGSYVILKYVRPVIKLRATQALSCPPAPVGVIDGCRADVSFIAGMIIDKFAYHQPLYRQHVKLQDAG